MHADENMFANRKLCIGIIGKNGQIMRARKTGEKTKNQEERKGKEEEETDRDSDRGGNRECEFKRENEKAKDRKGKLQ